MVERRVPRNLTAAEREAIIADASAALRKHIQDQQKPRGDVEIAEKWWGPALQRLNPIRVSNDRINVMITLVEDERWEEGLYVNVPISSYAPGKDRFATFETLSQAGDRAFGTLYHYRLKKPDSAGKVRKP